VNSEVEAAADLLPAVTEFAKATGLTEPVRELAMWAADLIRSRRLPHQARLMMRAAEKIRQSGMPTHAVSDKMLRAILENGPLEDDESMQERWANLLANAVTAVEGTIPPSFSTILSELEPIEAVAVDHLIGDARSWGGTARLLGDAIAGLDNGHIDNLARLGLVRFLAEDFTGPGAQLRFPEPTLVSTVLATRFAEACRAPAPHVSVDAP
jgi:hypothetical protein